MHRQKRRIKLVTSLTIAISVWMTASLGAQRHRKQDEAKNQTLPLPRELPMALAAETAGLDFHVSPLLKTGGLSAQIRSSLGALVRDTHGETIVKLRAFVSGAGDARRVQSEVSIMFSEHKLPLPVLTILQVGGFGEDRAAVEMEAVVSTRRNLNPNGLAFFSGESGGSLALALEHLSRSIDAASVPKSSVLQCSCFAARLEDGAAARASVGAIFPEAAINVVQALRDPADNSATCEAIGQLRRAPANGPLLVMADARAALVNTPRLVFTGMQLTFGNYLDDAREAFSRLQRAASGIEGANTPVRVDAFALDKVAAAALSKTTSVPSSTFTVSAVEGLPSVDASSGIEAILAPAMAQGTPPTR